MFYVSTGCAKPYNDWEKGAQMRLLMLFSLQWLVGLPWIFISLFLGTKALHNNCTSTLSRSRVTFPYAISADLMIPYQTRQSHHSYTCFTGGESDRERLNDIPRRIVRLQVIQELEISGKKFPNLFNFSVNQTSQVVSEAWK